MIRHLSIMRYLLVIPVLFGLSACAMNTVGPNAAFQPQPGQGQYVRPEWMVPTPTPRLPAVDTCQSQMYQILVGVNEGAIYIPGLPGLKRIIRPAVFEGPDNDFLNGEMMGDTYVQVQTYQAGQQLYAPTTANIMDRMTIRPENENRLTISLDRDGFVEEIACG